MSDSLRDQIIEIKNLFKLKEYRKEIKVLLFKLFGKNKYNLEEYIYLVKLLTENQKEFCEFRDFFIKMNQVYEKEIKEKNDKEKKFLEDKSDTGEILSVKKEEEKIEDNNKVFDINAKEEYKNFLELVKCMNEFPEKLEIPKKILIKATRDWMNGFIGKVLKKIKENNPSYINEKKKLIKEEKSKIIYESIFNLYESHDYKKIFCKLKSIPLDFINKQEKNKLIEICIQIYYDLTKTQKDQIREKYSEHIGNEEIAKILFLDIENIFADKNKVLDLLSIFIEDYSKKKDNKEKVQENNKKINYNNCDTILLNIFREFIHYKNKKVIPIKVKNKSNQDENNSYFIAQNENNIQEKIYFFLIINFINYKDQFIKGDKLKPFLYIEKYYEYNDLEKFMNDIDNIKNSINIYTEKDLKEEELIEKSYLDEKIDESDNEEDALSSYETDKLLKNNLLKFIPEKYFKIYNEVIKKINNFYKIPFPINSLVNYNNINFVCNIIDLILYFEKYSGNAENQIEENNKKEKKKARKEFIQKYIENLKRLEKDIFIYYKNSTLDYVEYEEDENNKILVGFKINQKMKNVYYDLKNKLNYELKKSLKCYKDYKIDYIPFGSITQFLSGENGDIDLFLDIKRISKSRIDYEAINEEKTEILVKLQRILKHLDSEIQFHQTNRLCLFTITYEGVKIDINVYGICSYYGEILLREYSLCDFRFPMLVIYLKHIISKKHIKNSEKEKIYINSFAWTNILLTFLQDILDPPLFPRLLNENNMKRINIKVGGGIGKDKKKELINEFSSQNNRYFYIIENPNKMREIEIKFYEAGKKEEKKIFYGRNQMSASEILLKFIQFIGYYFNYKYTFVNSSYKSQCFMPKIEKFNLKDDKDAKFFFDKCKDEEEILLIREPFDYTYNPCKTVQKEKLELIKKTFREIYINILEKGEI